METMAIIQLVTVLLPYFIKFLEKAESMEEVKETARLLRNLSNNEDLPMIIALIEKLK
jgi:hypothetical protein